MAGKYQNSSLDTILADIKEGQDPLNVVSQFENIKNLLIQEIENVEFLVWVAVAWFTDRDLANKLYSKSKQGVNVQIILNDDEINSKMLAKLKNYFEVYTVPKDTILMHNKFCIFDLKKVIHGSYNWTNKAQYNDETVSLIESRAQSEVFAEQFLKLKTKTGQHA
jgi:phosphatidylserine/phosphatidylglycerophosphate/cardiolipin synthase-like enzyme